MSDPRFQGIADELRLWLRQEEERGDGRVHIDWKRVREIQSQRAGARPGAAIIDSPQASSAPSGDFFTPSGPKARYSPQRKAEMLAALDREEVSTCVKCKLHATRTKTVFGTGNPDADLVFVGEAPGRDEDLAGEPFVGAAGQLLTKILAAIGLQREEVYICNVLKCRPPQNRDPERDEVQACEPYLKKQLDILQPKVICCLGRHAAHTLLDTRASLKSMRAYLQDYYGIPTVVTYHPAALLRNPQWKRPTWEDMQKLRAMLDRLRSES